MVGVGSCRQGSERKSWVSGGHMVEQEKKNTPRRWPRYAIKYSLSFILAARSNDDIALRFVHLKTCTVFNLCCSYVLFSLVLSDNPVCKHLFNHPYQRLPVH